MIPRKGSLGENARNHASQLAIPKLIRSGHKKPRNLENILRHPEAQVLVGRFVKQCRPAGRNLFSDSSYRSLRTPDLFRNFLIGMILQL